MKKVLLSVVAVMSLATATLAQSVPNYVPTNGLVGWWPFNGNANDESGNNNNGTVNGATLTTDRFGNTDKAYSFDGVNDFILFNLNSISNTFQSNTPSTSSLWVKTNDLNGPLISMQGNGGIEYDFHIGTLADIVQQASKFGILVRDNCCGTGNNIFGDQVSNGTWIMLTIVRSASGVLSLFKNAILVATSNAGQSGALNFTNNYMAFGSDRSWVIGSQNGCGSCNSVDQQHLNGILDDIGIWNRALSQQEITNLYNANICYDHVTVTDTLIINTNMVGFNPVTYQNTIKVWPNPAHDHITIDNGNIANLSGYQIKISNVLGQQVFQSAINQQQFYINLSTWTGNGTYYINLINPQGVTIETRVIVVQ